MDGFGVREISYYTRYETRLGSEWTLETYILAPEPPAIHLFCPNLCMELSIQVLCSKVDEAST